MSETRRIVLIARLQTLEDRVARATSTDVERAELGEIRRSLGRSA